MRALMALALIVSASVSAQALDWAGEEISARKGHSDRPVDCIVTDGFGILVRLPFSAPCPRGMSPTVPGFASVSPTDAVPKSAHLKIPVLGAYLDDTSPTGTSLIEGSLPLHAFAPASVLDALRNSIDQLDAAWASAELRFNEAETARTQGVAIAIAMSDVSSLQENETVSFTGNWSRFEGETGFAVGGALRLSQNASLNAGLASSADGRQVGTKLGFRIGW